MAAVYVNNLVINAGSDFSETFDLENSNNSEFNLTGYTALAQMRKYAGSPTATSFTVLINSPPSLGKITISLTSNQTVNLKPGRYVYDVVIEYQGVKTRVIEGMVIVREGVTR